MRTYWELNYEDFKNRFNINCKEYFKKEIDDLNDMNKDGLIEIHNDKIIITELGKDFAQFITIDLMHMIHHLKVIMIG